jgi:hypothetical protein
MNAHHAARGTGTPPFADPRRAPPTRTDSPPEALPDASAAADVMRIALDDCRFARPRRPLPDDLDRWAQTLRLPPPFARFGMAMTLRATLLRCWQAFESSYALGIEVRVGATGREVVCFGAMVYRIDGAGCPITTHLRDGHGRPVQRDLEMVRPLPDWRWVRDVLQAHAGLMWGLRCDLEERNLAGVINPFQAIVLMQHAWRWLAETITRMARRTIDLRAMRARLEGALALDAELVALARRMRPHAGAGVEGAGGWLARVAASRDAAREMARLAPGLLPFLGALLAEPADGGLSASQPSLATIRGMLRAAGATPADWRFLLIDPARPVWRMVRAGRIRGVEDIARFLGDWARLHRGLPGDRRLPSALWEPLADTWVVRLTDHVSPPVRWPFGPEVTAEAIRRWREAARTGRGEEFVAGEYGLLVRWAADYAEEGRPRLRSYRNALAAARRHDRRLRAAAATAAAGPWKFPPVPDLEGPWVVVPLRTPGDLVEEAIALHHCADRRADLCALGFTRLYSIRRRADGARIATIEVFTGKGKSPSLVEAKGLLNRPPPGEVLAFAKRLVWMLGWWQPPAKPVEADHARRSEHPR